MSNILFGFSRQIQATLQDGDDNDTTSAAPDSTASASFVMG